MERIVNKFTIVSLFTAGVSIYLFVLSFMMYKAERRDGVIIRSKMADIQQKAYNDSTLRSEYMLALDSLIRSDVGAANKFISILEYVNEN
jgi:hypothetical protein